MLLVCTAGAGSARARANGDGEDSGRWWWDARVGLGQQYVRNRVNGAAGTRYDQNDLKLNLGLNGFVFHPDVVRFRLDADLTLTQFDGGGGLDTDRLGLGAEVQGLPRGTLPFRLFFRRQRFDYSPGGDAPFLPQGLPDTGNEWGGLVRVQRGLLRGLLLNVEHTTFDFQEPDVPAEVQDRQVLDWNRPGHRMSHRVKLERRRHDFGRIALDTEDYALRIDERGEIAPGWRWELTGDGIRRDTRVADGALIETEDYRLGNRFLHTIRDRDLLDFFVNLRRFRQNDGPTTDGQEAKAFYRWRPGEAWEISPFGQLARQSADGLSVSAPRAGIQVNWKGTYRALVTHVNARASYGRTEVDDDLNGSRDDSQLAYGVGTSLSHRGPQGTSKSLELEWASSEFRMNTDPIFELPDLGLSGTGLGTEDRYRARLSAGKSWDSQHVSGWGEWSHHESAGGAGSADRETESYTSGLQWAIRRFKLQANAGETDVRTSVSGGQRLRFAGASVRWRPWRYLGLRAAYRVDQRDLALAENTDGTWAEAGLEIYLGRLIFDARAYERTDELTGGGRRVNRGFSWSLSTRFAGWLPIVTGTKRRGIIR